MTEWDWRAQRRIDERAVIEHIRRNGYIGQDALGDWAFTWEGTGDGGGRGDYDRIRAANQLRRQKPPKPKYEPMF